MMPGPVDRARLGGSALAVAPRLIGAVIVSHVGGEHVAIQLTEVEAYEGADDPASHAFRGMTPRTEVMFASAGHLYCYFTYGMHWCANIVCGADGTAAAVLLRAGDVIRGVSTARGRRPTARSDAELAQGPARLATCLGLAAAQNGIDVCDARSEIWLESMPSRRRSGVMSGPRVGISRAIERPWRFWLPDAPSVSRYQAGGRSRVRPQPAD